MRVSLAGFLNACLGGPRDWFVEHPGVCMMSAHARLPITRETADQWVDAMRRAITASPVEPGIAGKMAEALSAMAQGMARNPGQSMRSEEHTSELQSLMCISYAVFCLKKKKKTSTHLERQ